MLPLKFDYRKAVISDRLRRRDRTYNRLDHLTKTSVTEMILLSETIIWIQMTRGILSD